MTARRVAEEYQQIQRVITERYNQLEKTREVTEQQAAQLKVARRRREHLQLLRYISPMISIAIVNVMTSATLADYRKYFEQRVNERTIEF